jgi:hypothetical protein
LQTLFDAAWNSRSIDLPANILHSADDHSPTTALSRADAYALYLYARLRNQFSEEQLMQLGAQIAFRELSRTLESNFQCRERKFIQAAAKQIVTITTSLSALMCLPHRAVFRLVNSATRL